MRYGIIALLCVLAPVGSANAHTHHRYHHHHARMARHHHYRSHDDGETHIAGIHWEDTAAGSIKVADQYADKFKGLIADFVAAGYHPKDVGCFARGGHVRHSRHYLGQACDFDQTGWGKTAKFMYSSEAAAIIRKWGFTNGCSFRDCGHVGTDGQGGHYAVHRRIRYVHHGRHHAA